MILASLLSTVMFAAAVPDAPVTDDNGAEEIVGWLIENMEGTKEFVLSQAPDVVRQVVLIGRIEYTSAFVALLLIAIVAPFTAARIYRATSVVARAEIMFWTALLAIAIIPMFILVTHHMIVVWFAPKVYVLEYLSSLI